MKLKQQTFTAKWYSIPVENTLIFGVGLTEKDAQLNAHQPYAKRISFKHENKTVYLPEHPLSKYVPKHIIESIVQFLGTNPFTNENAI